MKVIVCCLFIIVNISNNGKASLESFGPTGTKILFEDTTKNLGKDLYLLMNFIAFVHLLVKFKEIFQRKI